jgi:hypothetical protein
MLVAAAAMYLRRDTEPHAQRPGHYVVLALCGAGVGFLTGFLGVGGGFLIVPALVLLLGKPMKQAVGTSLLVIALNCAVAVWGHRAALRMEWNIIVPSVAAALAGMAVGSLLARRLPSSALRKAFAVLVAALGVLMIARNAASIFQ